MTPFAIPLGLLSMGFWALTRDEGKPLFGQTTRPAADLRANVDLKAVQGRVVQAFKPQARNALLAALARKSLAAIPIDGQKNAFLYQLIPFEQGQPSAAQIVSTAQAKGLAVLASLTALDPQLPHYLIFAAQAHFAESAGQQSAFAILLAPSPVIQSAASTAKPEAPKAEAPHAIAIPVELQADVKAALEDDSADPAGIRRMAAVVTDAGLSDLAQALSKRADALELQRKMRAARDGAALPETPAKPKPEPRKKAANGAVNGAHALATESEAPALPAAEKTS